MEAPFVAAATAVWLGILTSISPCPLASNIVAIAYIGKGLANTRRVIMAGLLYTAGRMFTYAVLGVLLAASLASIVGVSDALLRHMNQLLGPVLIIAGMFVLELLKWNPGTGGICERVQRGADRWGLWGAAALGSVFALSFCPVSAALFFGSLIPLAIASGAWVVMPSLYGIGTGLPVLIIAGMFVLELLKWNPGTGGISERVQRGADRRGLWGAAALGCVFALSFCPVSAALFFGSLIPLAIASGAWVVMPSLYGIGTGLPVLGFAFLAAFGAGAIGSVFDRVARVELWARRVTGVVFIAVGVYYSLTYIFEVFS
jgi:cytochrome c biogenesis protein CcdA